MQMCNILIMYAIQGHSFSLSFYGVFAVKTKTREKG